MKKNSTTETLARNQTRPRSIPPTDCSAGRGAIQPPRKRLVPSTPTVIMFTYSAIWMSANFIEEYSVWNPATSSDSDSGRSKGMRLTSAVEAIAYTTKATIWRVGKEFQFQRPPPFEVTMSVPRDGPATLKMPLEDNPRRTP